MVKKLFKRLFLKNVRAGFATNSSSTHSLVFYKPHVTKMLKTDMAGYDNWDFGWGSFVLADRFTKLVYGILSLNGGLWYDPKANELKEFKEKTLEKYGQILENLSPGDSKKIIESAYSAGFANVDHQSVPYISDRNDSDVSFEEATFLHMLADEDSVVYGGNDAGGPGPESFVLHPMVEAVYPTWTPERQVKVDIYLDENTPERPISVELEERLVSMGKHPKDVIEVRRFIKKENGGRSTEIVSYDEWRDLEEGGETITSLKELTINEW